MTARLLSLAILGASLFLNACATPPSTDADKARQIVESAGATLDSFTSSNEPPMEHFRNLMPRAHGVVIFPGLIKGGFIVGAEGGNGVLLARDAAGAWGQPAFYTLASGSIGLQVGGQMGDTVLLVFSPDAVKAIVEHQGKLGADLGLVVGTVGAGVEAATTANIGADVLAFSKNIGMFAGGSLEAAALIKRNDLNAAFYGRNVSSADIVLAKSVSNPAADGLRAALAQR
ncbi:MAG: lipid-binding SYLF domain-containing protein [Alphaproteobacteria bacterium]|nr:lipid-binding SYLF domain-containing protein [Alphaproteobacteria bacterium]MBF0251928.1 lipid-binding SYLF domain-containing protein [Alphaproteobacteria bacterium]